ncbi:MAG: GNAT family N-acetyltransferase [Paracoccus sp. (in: a-proteobacteria)]|uniref:GNAT family N-acetyltransferase n=1 Tax=Paracoccus sp. TaxID=267 RepID=UPI00391CC2D7
MIPVDASDLPAAIAALDRVAEGPVFLQSNLARYGLAPGAPRSVHLWANAERTAFVGLTVAGILMPQMREAGSGDWAALPQVLAGHEVLGINGASAQVAACLSRLDLPPPRLDRTEPCFALPLSDLRMPAQEGLELRPVAAAEMELLTGWRAAYRVETVAETPAEARTAARAELPLWLAEDGLRLLWRGGRPVALSGLNARAGGCVQVGGVYTPPDLRGQGLARAAVALHLAELRAQGAGRAFLFAASPVAERAYRAIGFQPAGHMRMVVLPSPIGIAP